MQWDRRAGRQEGRRAASKRGLKQKGEARRAKARRTQAEARSTRNGRSGRVSVPAGPIRLGHVALAIRSCRSCRGQCRGRPSRAAGRAARAAAASLVASRDARLRPYPRPTGEPAAGRCAASGRMFLCSGTVRVTRACEGARSLFGQHAFCSVSSHMSLNPR